VTSPGPSDPRLADFAALNEPATRRRVERAGDYFVVEGVLAIERLLSLPQWHVRSLALLSKVAERLATQIDDAGIGRDHVAVVDEDALRRVVGFDLHRGALASVDRRAPIALGSVVPPAGLLLVCEGVNDHENLGALYRNAAAFGVTAVALDPTCADPFYRRSVRVSLGQVLAVPTARLGPSPEGIATLHRLGVTTVALTPRGETELRDLSPELAADRPVAVLLGAEGPGLEDATLAAAQHRVRIAMTGDVDSLNVATAAVLVLHHLAPR
jgi:tRNA G18 (ribose-2'-O)-methylase SpoU